MRRRLFRLGAALAIAFSAFILASTVGAQTVVMDPALAGLGPRGCLDCHHLPNLATNEGALANQALCLECHGQKDCVRQEATQKVPLFVDKKQFAGSTHKFKGCVECHFDAARSPHASMAGVQCLSCHPPHGEGEIGDPHLRVRCEACHHKGEFFKQDLKTGLVGLAGKSPQGKLLSLADHTPPSLERDQLCARCHIAGNQVGAPTVVLPDKGVICFMCHTASLSLGSWWQAVALGLFLFGLISMACFWMKGKVADESESGHRKLAEGSERLWSTVFSREFRSILAAWFFDVILARRLLTESVRRWFFHSLIYLAILARLGLGVFTWLVQLIWPDSGLTAALIDKNHGFTAFTYDLLGLFILLGVILAAATRWGVRPKHSKSEYQDNLALIFLGVMVILGFVLEAVRILVGHMPPTQMAYAFVAYPLSRVLAGMSLDWNTAYSWLWYAHAVVAAGFIAYLPFGKMRHMFTVPLSLMINRKLE